jgi:hypothetical protein
MKENSIGTLTLRAARTISDPEEIASNFQRIPELVCDPQDSFPTRKKCSNEAFSADSIPDFAEISETLSGDAPKVKPKPIPATLWHEDLGADKTNHNGVKCPPLSTSLSCMEPPKPSISTLQGGSNFHKIEELLIKLEEIKKSL